MTTQTVSVELCGPRNSRIFELTATDGIVNELLSQTALLSAFDIVMGYRFTHAFAEFAAGICIIRIRDQITDETKALIICDPVGEGKRRKLRKPVVIGKNDIVECYVDVA